MPEGSRRLGEVCVRAAVALRALVEGVARSDPRVAWVREQATVCVREGMAPREAVALAWDLAFRHYGQEPPTRGT